MFRSVWDQIHSVYTGPVLNWNGTVKHRMITFIGGPIWYKIADPIRTGSIGSRVNTRLIRTNFVPVPNGSGPYVNAALRTFDSIAWSINLHRYKF